MMLTRGIVSKFVTEHLDCPAKSLRDELLRSAVVKRWVIRSRDAVFHGQSNGLDTQSLVNSEPIGVQTFVSPNKIQHDVLIFRNPVEHLAPLFIDHSQSELRLNESCEAPIFSIWAHCAASEGYRPTCVSHQ
jgi:hypothetical protein